MSRTYERWIKMSLTDMTTGEFPPTLPKNERNKNCLTNQLENDNRVEKQVGHKHTIHVKRNNKPINTRQDTRLH